MDLRSHMRGTKPRAGKQNRTAIPSMASWCTNRCAIPAFVLPGGFEPATERLLRPTPSSGWATRASGGERTRTAVLQSSKMLSTCLVRLKYPAKRNRTDKSRLPESRLRHHFVCFYTPIETHNKEKSSRSVRPDPALGPMD